MVFLIRLDQREEPNEYKDDHTIPTSSSNNFFSPQTAFYAPSSLQQTSNMAYPLLRNVVEEGMKDIAGRTANMLPNEVKIMMFSFLPILN